MTRIRELPDAAVDDRCASPSLLSSTPLGATRPDAADDHSQRSVRRHCASRHNFIASTNLFLELDRNFTENWAGTDHLYPKHCEHDFRLSCKFLRATLRMRQIIACTPIGAAEGPGLEKANRTSDRAAKGALRAKVWS